MFSSNFKIAFLVLFAVFASLALVQADITADPKQRIPRKLGEGEGAILIVGNVADIAISASNTGGKKGKNSSRPATPSSAVCHKVMNENAKTFQGPCFIELKKPVEVFHAECLKGKGSASITFYREPQNGYTAEVQAVNGIWAGFSKEKPLKQGTLHAFKKGVKVILNCENDKSIN